jgi:hypothetical protein
VEPRDIALSQARGRIAVGLLYVLAPGLAGRAWIGADGDRPAVRVLSRAFGVRDLALGLGVVLGIQRGAPVRGWLEAGAMADAVDGVATLLAGDSIPTAARRGVVALAVGSAATAAWLSRELGQTADQA